MAIQGADNLSDERHLGVTTWYLKRAGVEAPRYANAACRVAKALYGLPVFTT